MSEPEDQDAVLFETRNAYLFGDYQRCIIEAQKISPTTQEAQVERDCLMYRAYAAQNKFSIPMQEIADRPSTPASLLAVRLYCRYKMAESDAARKSCVSTLGEMLMQGGSDYSYVFFIMAALIYLNEEDIERALRVLNNADSLEALALKIHCLLLIDRVDLALKTLKIMQDKDEDATCSQLALAWVNLAMGKEKLQESFFIFQEMIDKYGETSLLLVSQSTCLIQQLKWEQAEEVLNKALQMDPNNAEAIVNMIVVAQHLGKPAEHSNRYITQMKEGYQNHHWTKDLAKMEEQFDNLVAATATARQG